MTDKAVQSVIRDDILAASPETVTFDQLITWLASVRDFDWEWARNTRCKYVDIRIDTRRGAFAILDRDGQKITLDELRYQFRAKASPEGGRALNDLQRLGQDFDAAGERHGEEPEYSGWVEVVDEGESGNG